MAGLLDMLRGRGDEISNLANVARSGTAIPQPAVAVQPQQVQLQQEQVMSFQDMMNQLTIARQAQKKRLATEAIQKQGGQVLPAQ